MYDDKQNDQDRPTGYPGMRPSNPPSIDNSRAALVQRILIAAAIVAVVIAVAVFFNR